MKIVINSKERSIWQNISIIDALAMSLNKQADLSAQVPIVAANIWVRADLSFHVCINFHFGKEKFHFELIYLTLMLVAVQQISV